MTRQNGITIIQGHHEDIADTSRGCIMDVVSMLAGEIDITDTPACYAADAARSAVLRTQSLQMVDDQLQTDSYKATGNTA